MISVQDPPPRRYFTWRMPTAARFCMPFQYAQQNQAAGHGRSFVGGSCTEFRRRQHLGSPEPTYCLARKSDQREGPGLWPARGNCQFLQESRDGRRTPSYPPGQASGAASGRRAGGHPKAGTVSSLFSWAGGDGLVLGRLTPVLGCTTGPSALSHPLLGGLGGQEALTPVGPGMFQRRCWCDPLMERSCPPPLLVASFAIRCDIDAQSGRHGPMYRLAAV